jgi:hypothetical protein
VNELNKDMQDMLKIESKEHIFTIYLTTKIFSSRVNLRYHMKARKTPTNLIDCGKNEAKLIPLHP